MIKRMAVDHMHIVGDIFDRGPRADIIMDSLLEYHSVDIQWGNHDILWMGAASGSRTLVATVLANSIHYNNLEVIETGYGISLRPLSVFANEVYRDCDVHRFAVKLTGPDADQYSEKDKLLSARMHKAITIILFKLEGQKLLRHPEYGMADRLLLDKIDYENKLHHHRGRHLSPGGHRLPHRGPQGPLYPHAGGGERHRPAHRLLPAQREAAKARPLPVLQGRALQGVQRQSAVPRLHPHDRGRAAADLHPGRQGARGQGVLGLCRHRRPAGLLRTSPAPPERQLGMDFLWFLWAGRNSPIFGRDRMTTFERRLIKDESAWTEPKNAYYTYYQDPAVCDALLKEFGLEGPHCHIINGHIPVKSKKGESPIKGGGKLLVIDGGFCRAYQPTTGIAGTPSSITPGCCASSPTSPSAAKGRPSRRTRTSPAAPRSSSGWRPG